MNFVTYFAVELATLWDGKVKRNQIMVWRVLTFMIYIVWQPEVREYNYRHQATCMYTGRLYARVILKREACKCMDIWQSILAAEFAIPCFLLLLPSKRLIFEQEIIFGIVRKGADFENPKIRYAHCSSLLNRILIQMNHILTLKSCLYRIRFNNILQCTQFSYLIPFLQFI